ncbi:uncharacterized protein LOC143039284 [Oratosquilla oratoria]|uniref:uncharacterized protein LOC143039284 n=1 Tax=Oratosquilla oratoria TaxID=337810 RepID=UPI003F760324
MPNLGKVAVRFDLAGFPFQHSFFIIPAEGLSSKLILGFDFLAAHKVTLTFRPLTFKVKGTGVPVILARMAQQSPPLIAVCEERHSYQGVGEAATFLVKTSEAHWVPGFSGGTITLTLERADKLAPVGQAVSALFTARPYAEGASLLGQGVVALLRMENEKAWCKVPFLNLSPDTREIRKDQVVGELTPLVDGGTNVSVGTVQASNVVDSSRGDKLRLEKEVAYLGHVISQDGIKPQPDKVRAIKTFPRPARQKELLSFLGLAGYYRKFIPNFAEISLPLVNMTKGDVAGKHKNRELGPWTPPQLHAFESLKSHLSSTVVLPYPNFAKPFLLTTDASASAIGGVLQQEDDGGRRRPLSYFSRTLNEHERRYSTVEKEALAAVYGLTINRPLIMGYPVRLLSDHRPLVWLFTAKGTNTRILRWQMAIADIDIEVNYIPGRLNIVADALSRIRGADHPIDDFIVSQISTGGRGNSNSNSEEDTITWNQLEIRKEQDAHPDWGRLKEYLRGATSGAPKIPRLRVPIGEFRLLPDGLLYHARRNAYQLEELRLRVHVDLISPLATTLNGAKYILTVVDVLTRFLVAVSIKSKEARTVARAFLNHVLAIHGAPRQVISDGGGEFMN